MNWSTEIKEEGFYWMRHPDKAPKPLIREIVHDLSGEGWFVLFPGVNIQAERPDFEGWEFWGPLSPPTERASVSNLTIFPRRPSQTSATQAEDSSSERSPSPFAQTPSEELPGAEPGCPNSSWARS